MSVHRTFLQLGRLLHHLVLCQLELLQSLCARPHLPPCPSVPKHRLVRRESMPGDHTVRLSALDTSVEQAPVWEEPWSTRRPWVGLY